MKLPKLPPVPRITDPLPLNVIVHVIILFTILSCLFFFYIAGVEQAAFRSQFDSIGDQLSASLQAAPAAVKAAIRALPLAEAARLYSVPDPTTVEHNAWMRRVPVFVLIAMFAVLLASFAACGFCFNMLALWVQNVIIFAFIGVVEFAFFYFIAAQFVPAPPSTLITTAYARIKQRLAGAAPAS